MGLYLAIDAGGTKTDYVLADDVAVLARARSATVKRMRASAEVAAEHLADGLASLERTSGRSLQTVTRTVIGTAGESVPLVADFLKHELTARVAGELLLLGDVEIALDAAFRGGPGVLALAGTGSNVAGRDRSGRLHNRGGWGPVLSDAGSGMRIGVTALRQVFFAIDERAPNALEPAILRYLQLASREALVEAANGTPALDYPKLVQPVLDAAASGDPLAQEVLRVQGEELGYTVRQLMRGFTVPGTWQIACAGSILEHVEAVRAAMLQEVQREFPTAALLPGVVDPVEGALWRARDAFAFSSRLQSAQLPAS